MDFFRRARAIPTKTTSEPNASEPARQRGFGYCYNTGPTVQGDEFLVANAEFFAARAVTASDFEREFKELPRRPIRSAHRR